MARVVLVYPEVYDLARFKEKRKEFPPFGVLYLAAVAELEGHEVTIEKVSPSHTRLDFAGADLVAFSVPSSATYGIAKEARFNSTYDGDPIIAVGGVHPNFYPEQTVVDFAADVVGVGEGEDTFLDLLAVRDRRRLVDVPGLIVNTKDGLVRTAMRPMIKDIDHLPLPARHLLDVDDLVMADRLSNTDLQMAHIMLSRGCPFPCRFCAAAQTRMQYRSGASARHELIHLKETYGVEGFAVVDDNFIVNKRKVADVCESIKDLSLTWSALSRVDTVDEPLLHSMRGSGCIEIKFGMESGSERMLKAMGKRIKQDQIRNAVRTAHEAGINVKLFLIHGYPGENRESTHETMRMLEELAPMVTRVALFRFVPLPGTYVYNNPLEFGLRGTDKAPDWNGDWGKYHIHHNDDHWWGTDAEFTELTSSYAELRSLVDVTWPERFDAPASTATVGA